MNASPYFVYVIIFLIFIILIPIAHITSRIKVSKLRRAGLYPLPGKGSIKDVRDLIKNNEPIMAIKCYREIFSCSLKDAKAAVDTLSENR